MTGEETEAMGERPTAAELRDFLLSQPAECNECCGDGTLLHGEHCSHCDGTGEEPTDDA